jgi:ribonuclease P protein component
MLAKKNRISTPFFEQVLKKSRVVHTPLFSVRIQNLKSTNSSIPTASRFAVVVSKKVAETAVKRNLIKRRVRAVLEDILKKNKFKNPIAGIFFIKKEALVTNFTDLKTEIKRVIMNI